MLHALIDNVSGTVHIDGVNLRVFFNLHPYDARTMDHIDFAPVFLLTG